MSPYVLIIWFVLPPGIPQGMVFPEDNYVSCTRHVEEMKFERKFNKPIVKWKCRRRADYERDSNPFDKP